MPSISALTTVLVALLVTLSAVGKIRQDARQVAIIHGTVGIPLKYFPLLAAGELLGAIGLLAGLEWPSIGIAAGVWLVLYFLGAIGAHVRVNDVKGIGPAVTMWALAALVLFIQVRSTRSP